MFIRQYGVTKSGGEQSVAHFATKSVTRLAIVSTHPIQYYAPWFRHLSGLAGLELCVFFLLEPPADGQFEPGFQQKVKWDLPLLQGYAYEFVPNTSARPSTHGFWGLHNPDLKCRVERFAPDAVMLMAYNYASLVHFILAWDSREAPLIFRGDSHRIAHGRSAKESMRRALIRLLFRRFSAFLYVGRANYRYFTYHGAREHALFHSPHAVDMQRFADDDGRQAVAAAEWRRSLGIADEHLVFLFAGKFEEKKRPLDLLKAFNLIDTRDCALLFVGAGELEGAMRDAAHGHDNVYFAPFQNQSLMPRAYAACDVLVLPSFGAFETWGLAVNEAMAAGKPAIVSTHVGCAEDLVKPGVTGLVFEAGNVGSLAQALSRAAQSRQQLSEWGAAARAHVSAFNYAAAASGLLAAISSVCPCSPQSSIRSPG